MRLTKKEISENIKLSKLTNFPSTFDYHASIRGFLFETHKNNELYEEDDQGNCTFIEHVNNKKEVVNAIYDWFKEYASQEFDN